jgi:hypothetical protein
VNCGGTCTTVYNIADNGNPAHTFSVMPLLNCSSCQ